MELFHVRLKTLREKKGLKLIQMANRLGVPASTYRAWEHGKSIQGEPYVKIAEILETSISELMTGDAPAQENILSQAEEILAKLRTLVETLRTTE